eukprot:897624-Rhodomonas_salina.1
MPCKRALVSATDIVPAWFCSTLVSELCWISGQIWRGGPTCPTRPCLRRDSPRGGAPAAAGVGPGRSSIPRSS